MSEFWNASAPPAQADIIAWCEREVETACMDLWANVKLFAHFDGRQFLVYPYADNWDLDKEDANRGLAELITEAADMHVSYVRDEAKRGIYGETRENIERDLQEIEAAIAGVRALYRDGPA